MVWRIILKIDLSLAFMIQKDLWNTIISVEPGHFFVKGQTQRRKENSQRNLQKSLILLYLWKDSAAILIVMGLKATLFAITITAIVAISVIAMLFAIIISFLPLLFSVDFYFRQALHIDLK